MNPYWSAAITSNSVSKVNLQHNKSSCSFVEAAGGAVSVVAGHICARRFVRRFHQRYWAGKDPKRGSIPNRPRYRLSPRGIVGGSSVPSIIHNAPSGS